MAKHIAICIKFNAFLIFLKYKIKKYSKLNTKKFAGWKVVIHKKEGQKQFWIIENPFPAILIDRYNEEQAQFWLLALKNQNKN